MEFYKAWCILEEIENLKFLNNYNINVDSKYIFQIERIHASDKIKNENMPFEHLPEMDVGSKIDYYDWRKRNNYPEIDDLISNHHLSNRQITTVQIEKLNVNDLLMFFTNSNLVSEIKKKIKLDIHFEYCSSNEYKCVELPYSKKSVILMGRKKERVSFEESIYLFHEIGHAIYNSFKYDNSYYVPIELDELFAHIFEFYFYYNYHYLKMGMDKDLLSYKSVLHQKLTNNVIYTDFLYHLYKKKLMKMKCRGY